MRVVEAHFFQPACKLWSRLETEKLPKAQKVVEGQALVIEHDVISSWHPDQKGDPGSSKKNHQVVHIILIRFSMIGVAGVTPHRDA